ncbi:hypothetical protein HBI18_246740 [Parastagonospora nodorum]|nr:hypothetical protein HBI18_246740 [Parastagonospora nodorum]
MNLNFVPSIAFIPNVHIADSLRARTPINPSAVLYEQAAAQTSLPAKVSNIDLDFVPSIAFIPNVHMADSLRARTLINPSAVLYEQAAARTSLPAKVSNISPRARTLINPSAVLYKQADARSSLPAKVSIIDLDFVPSVAFDAIGNVELTGNLPGNADRVNNNNNNIAPTLQFSLTALLNPRSLASKRPASSSSDLNRRRTDLTIASQISLVEQLHNVQKRTASPAKRIKTDEDRKNQAPSQTGPSINLTISNNNNVQLVRDNIEELICVSKVKHTYVQAHTVPYPDLKKYLSNSTENLAYNISKFYKSKNIQLLRPQGLTPRELGSIYVLQIISKSDKVPTQEPSSHIKTELYPHQKQALYFMLRDNNRKFYRLVITSEDTYCKQTIKKAYIMSPERALLILFMT